MCDVDRMGFARLAEYRAAHSMLDGVAAAAVGFALSMGAQAARRSVRDVLSAVVLAGCFAAIGIARLPTVAVVAVAAPLSIAAAWVRLGRQERR